MEFTLQELNEIYYCLGKTLQSHVPNMANKDLVNQIADKIRDEIDRVIYETESNQLMGRAMIVYSHYKNKGYDNKD